MKIDTQSVSIVVMTKPAVPGYVKTRLCGEISPSEAAQVHAAMCRCVLERVEAYVPQGVASDFYVAMDDTVPGSGINHSVIGVSTGPWQSISQGEGDLGQRLAHVWKTIGSGIAVFFGVDTPDVPPEVLGSILPALAGDHTAVGPVEDGGYWVLAARAFELRLLTGIDWGTPSVYHQTCAAAKQAGLRMATLKPWYDVDLPADLSALRGRIKGAVEPALVRLRGDLDRILEGHQP